MSSPVPYVVAWTGSFPSGPPTRPRPDAAAISITATSPSSRHARDDHRAERTGHRARAVRPAKHVKTAFAAVGERTFTCRPSEVPGAVRHCPCGARSGERAAKLVGGRNELHRPPLDATSLFVKSLFIIRFIIRCAEVLPTSRSKPCTGASSNRRPSTRRRRPLGSRSSAVVLLAVLRSRSSRRCLPSSNV